MKAAHAFEGMTVMKGRPLVLKCPKCKRGQHRQPRQRNGVIVAMHEERERWAHGRFVTQHKATCLDCDHVWWTTLTGRRVTAPAHSNACLTTRLLSGDPNCPACGDKTNENVPTL